MTFEELIKEGMEIITQYKETLYSIDRDQVQIYRDSLSALCVTLSVYKSDYYDEYIAAEMRRKIFEARETDRIRVDKVSAATASIQARIAAEPYYKAEIEADQRYNRAKSLLETWNQVLNSFASRMHEKQRQ